MPSQPDIITYAQQYHSSKWRTSNGSPVWGILPWSVSSAGTRRSSLCSACIWGFPRCIVCSQSKFTWASWVYASRLP